jgi:hypothetical protein
VAPAPITQAGNKHDYDFHEPSTPENIVLMPKNKAGNDSATRVEGDDDPIKLPSEHKVLNKKMKKTFYDEVEEMIVLTL